MSVRLGHAQHHYIQVCLEQLTQPTQLLKKLLPVPAIIFVMSAELGPGQGFKALDAQPAVVANDDGDRAGTAELTPLSFQKGAKGVSPTRSPGSAVDHLGLSVR